MQNQTLPLFDADYFTSGETFARVGGGGLGGKAMGLLYAKSVLDYEFDRSAFPRIDIGIPRSIVVGTDYFDAFVADNDLADLVFSDTDDDAIGDAVAGATLPAGLETALRLIIDGTSVPLAVRSSSLLEDTMFHPLAGVYETKMVPNADANPDVRFRQLVEAVKFVYASTFRRSVKNYLTSTGQDLHDEKMAVLVQEVVGSRYEDRYYPVLSGVGKSYNFYPTSRSKPEDGVVSLALGLGKTIVDSSTCWTYSPARPKAPPPFASLNDQLKNTQLEFWAVNVGTPTGESTGETEFMTREDLTVAERDGTLRHVASTIDPASGRLVMGTGPDGPRVLDFALLLDLADIPLNDVVRALLSTLEKELGAAVEMEFAMTTEDGYSAGINVLQVRLMAVSEEVVEVRDDEMEGEDLLLASERAIGNGTAELTDVVYVKPASFDIMKTRVIAQELDEINHALVASNTPYLLIGFGRWGSSDPSLGIPVEWGQICGARAIVEATNENMVVEPSQGSHFFHNMTSLKVSYFTVPHHRSPGIAWHELDAHDPITETAHVRHVRLPAPVRVKVDGRSGRGTIRL